MSNKTPPGRAVTVGARKLQELTESPESRRKVAESLNVSTQCIANWRKGTSLPRLDLAFKLEDLHNIKARSWVRAAS